MKAIITLIDRDDPEVVENVVAMIEIDDYFVRIFQKDKQEVLVRKEAILSIRLVEE